MEQRVHDTSLLEKDHLNQLIAVAKHGPIASNTKTEILRQAARQFLDVASTGDKRSEGDLNVFPMLGV